MNASSAAPDQTVYIVDDDDALRDSLVWLLESNAHHVEQYASAEAFLAAYHGEMAGCIVLDVRMPGMSGLELYERLRERHARLPVVFITGHGDVQMAVSMLKKGAVDFIEKPFSDRDMLKLIDQCLATERENRDRLRQLRRRQPGQDRQRGARADAGDAHQLAEGRALGLGGEAVQQLRVLAHDEMRQQRQRLADRGQAVEGAHRHVELVADAVHVQQHLRRRLRRQRSDQVPT